MVLREAQQELLSLAKQYKTIAVIGPRQSGKTITQDYFKGLRFWSTITGFKGGKVIYAGADYQKRSNGFEVIPLNLLTEKIDN
ncbi:hypothetical protein [Snuella lapsa]|uniref:AAA domain-containing protein n=1 Tax=Snuella lapsa TaxID=870481 RepID=A0ABP6XEA7_9FLAO